MKFPAHSVDQLRQQCAAESTRPFNARGVTLKRCPQCLLGINTCICDWRKPHQCKLEFVLLMHRDEVFKPTNTGRLIADLFPDQCRAFLWSRTEPDEQLLRLVNDPARRCLIIFPPSEHHPRERVSSLSSQGCSDSRDGKQTPIQTVILLDGTWKQARKMFTQGRWMQHLPLLDLSDTLADSQHDWGNYQVRQACEKGQLATAEAAALALAAHGEDGAADRLMHYFHVFNHHYVAARMNRDAGITDAHQALSEL